MFNGGRTRKEVPHYEHPNHARMYYPVKGNLYVRDDGLFFKLDATVKIGTHSSSTADFERVPGVLSREKIQQFLGTRHEAS